MAMRALAWDDVPEDYFNDLATHLEQFGITTVVCRTLAEFETRYNEKGARWDLVITDLVRADHPAPYDQCTKESVAIMRHVRDLPVFLVTRYTNVYDLHRLGVPPEVILRTKETPAGFQAENIRSELRHRGLFVDRHKLFLIFGHDRNAPGTTNAIISRYQAKNPKLEIVQVKPDRLFTEINHGLVERMHDCAAVIAVCTPDDEVHAPPVGPPGKSAKKGEVYFQPRQNVLYEMGLALGLGRGLKRLVILQKIGPTPDQVARLPSDLGGVLALQFSKAVGERFDDLDAKLRELGVDLG